MSSAWNTESTEGVAKVTVRGNSRDVDVGVDFAETILEIARDEGLSKFRVFMNGEEIQPEDAQETFEDGNDVEIRPYDWAG